MISSNGFASLDTLDRLDPQRDPVLMAEVIVRCANVERVLCGHVDRPILQR